MSDNMLGIIIILAVIAVAAFGGAKNSKSLGFFSVQQAPQTQEQKQANVARDIQTTQTQIDKLKKQIQLTEEQKSQSKYFGIIKIQFINRSQNSSGEYVTLHMDNSATTTIPITGWVLKSLSSGNSVTIPKGTYLIFYGSINSEDPIILTGGDTVYLSTGISPNGYSFKLNKCSGYMSQFQNFTPYISTTCPAPRDENLSSIPKTVVNDACFDYIESFPSCRIQTGQFPLGLSTECQNFFNEKINYKSCVNIHKNDKDFYLYEWRVYLKRSDRIWKDRRETVVLYDSLGKIVDTIKY